MEYLFGPLAVLLIIASCIGIPWLIGYIINYFKPEWGDDNDYSTLWGLGMAFISIIILIALLVSMTIDFIPSVGSDILNIINR